MTDIWISSDWHFQHVNILQYTNRHKVWNSPEEMTEALIRNWNSCVKPEDEHYILGDLMMGQSKNWESILNRLNGRLYLVAGNHDIKLRKQQYAINRFEWIKDYHEMTVRNPLTNKKTLIVMSHYAPYAWNRSHHGSWALSGHSHGSLDSWHRERLSMDVGIDSEHNKGYKPFSLFDIAKIMSEKQIKFVDHHDSDTNP